MLTYVHQFILNWLFTLLVEIPALIVIARYFFKIPREKISLSWLILGGVFASTMTIPWVWFVFPVFFYNSMTFAIAIGEIFAFVVEATFYVFAFKISARQAVIISFIANMFSFLLGQILLRP